MAMLVRCKQGDAEWFQARAGACTASRFRDARSWTGGLSAQQQAYVDALRAGRGEEAAMEAAGYKQKPSFAALADAIAGKKIGQPSDAALKYAQLLAIERIAGAPLDDTFQTWAMRRGHELEPKARELYMERTGYVVDESGILLSDDRRVGYSTDGEVYGQPGGIEIKCPVAADKVAGIWLDPEPVIAEFLDQCDGGMWLAHWQWIDLVVYTPWLSTVGKELFIHRIHRDDARIDALTTDLVGFLRIVNDYEARLRGLPAPSLAEVPPWMDPQPAAAAPVPVAPPAPAPKPAPRARLVADF